MHNFSTMPVFRLKVLQRLLIVLMLFVMGSAQAQFNTGTITLDGNAAEAAYVTTGAYHMAWDDTYLYVRYTGGNQDEPVIMHFDVDPQNPVDGGSNANGSLTGATNWGITPTLPFRSDFQIYWESLYAEYRTDNGAGGWNGSTVINSPADRSNTGTSNREIRLAWTWMGLGGRPAAFNWTSFANSRAVPGFIFNQMPSENPTGFNGAPTFNYYYTVSSTANDANITNPFSRKSFESRSNFTLNTANTFWDFTVNGGTLTNAASHTVNNQLYVVSGTLTQTGARTFTFGSLSTHTPTLRCDGTINPNNGAGNDLICTFAAGTSTLSGTASDANFRLFDINVSSGATLQSPSSGGVSLGLQFGTMTVNGTGVLNFRNGTGAVNVNVVNNGTNNYNFSNTGGTASFNTLTVSTGATFRPVSSGTHNLNIRGNLVNTPGTYSTANGTGILHTTFNGVIAQNISTSATFQNVTIANTSATVTLLSGTMTIASGRTLAINASSRLDLGTNGLNATGATISVDGFLRRGGAGTGALTGVTAANTTFNATGVYEHNFTTVAGDIPMATWSTGSLCSIIGYTTNTGGPSNMDQIFHNFLYSCPAQSSTVNLQLSNGTATVETNGNFTVANTGSGTLLLNDASNYFLTVDGNFVHSGGNLTLAGTGGGSLFLNGNFTKSSAGTLDLKSGSGVGQVSIQLLGDFTHSAGPMTKTSADSPGATINLVRSTGTQTINQTGGTFTATTNVNWSLGDGSTTQTVLFASNLNLGTSTGFFNILNGTTANFQTFVLSGNGTLLAGAGSILRSANTDAGGTFALTGANGSIQLATRNYTTGVNYFFAGAAAQVAGTGLGASNTGSITISNAAGVSLNSNVTMSASANLNLTSGRLTLGNFNLTLGVSSTVTGTLNASNMVVATGTGELRKVFTAPGSFVYPVGDNTATAEYSPITLNYTSGTFSSAFAGVRLENVKHPSNASASHYLNRYWVMNSSGISAYSLTYTANYLTADIVGTEANLFGGLRNSGNTAWLCQNAVNATPNTISNTISNIEGGVLTAGESGEMGCVVAAPILTFEFAGLAGSETTAGSNFNDAGLTSSTISRGAGLTAAANADRFNATNWALTSIANAVSGNNYMEIVVTPQAGFQFDVTTINIQLQRSLTGPSAIVLRSSIDGFATNIDGVKTIVDVATTQSFTFAVNQNNNSSPVTYRFYAYAEASGGSGGIGDGAGNDIVVNGIVSSLGTITTGTVSGSPFCAGATGINVPFTYSPAGNFPNGTATFTAQLSDASGSFTTPTNLQSVTSNGSGSQSINVNIPGGTANGTAYRIRVVSSSPTVNGSNNGANLTINNTTTTIAPATTQNIATSTNGTTLTVTEGYAPTSRQWKYGTTSGGPYTVNLGTATTQIPNFATAGTYYIVCESTYGAPCNTTVTSNQVQINVTAPTPDILITGNSVTIADGDNTPDLADHTNFGSVAWGAGFTRTYTIQNNGTGTLNIGTITFAGAAAGDYAVTTAPSASVAPSGSTTFVVTFSPSAVGIRNATITVNSNDPDAAAYDYALTGTGTPSNLSTIEFNSSFTTPQNIAYANFQETDLTGASLSVMEFRILDGGVAANDADNLSTVLNSITLNITNWSVLRRIALYWGGTEIAEAAVTGPTVTFSGLSGTGVTATDGLTRIIAVKASFNSTVTDNTQFSFSFTNADVTALSTNSQFANFGTVSSQVTADRNRIEVTADRIEFSTQPNNTSVSVNMTPFTVAFVDALGNRDFDTNRTVTLSTSGTNMSPATPSGSITAPHSGTVTFSTVQFTSGPQTAITITANTTGLSVSNTVVSDPFNVLVFNYLVGDYRPSFDGSDFSINGGWESFNGTTWVTGVTAPQNLVPASRPSRIIIDKTNIGGAGSSTNRYNNIIILDGGELIITDDDTPPVASEFMNAGTTLEVQSGGILRIQGDIDLPTTANLIVRGGGTMYINQASMVNNHPMWDGIENFENNSTVVINNWDWTASPTAASLVNVSTAITNNAGGWKFGNLIVDANITSNWNLIGGGVGIINLVQNDLDISNSNTTTWVTGATNATGTNGYVVNGNLTIFDGNFAFGASYSNSAFNHQFTINGDFEVGSNDQLKLHYIGSGTPTTLNGFVTFNGDVIIGSTVTAFTNDGGSGTPARIGMRMLGGTQVSPNILNVAPVAVAVPITIGNGTNPAYIQLAGQNLATNSVTGYTAAITVSAQATLDFGFNAALTAALNITKSGTGGTNTFTSSANSTLVITSPDGIQQASGTTGNVQYTTANKTFSPTATFWYKGRVNQVTGDGLPSTSTGKVVIVELLNSSTTLTLTNSTGITSNTAVDPLGGKLEIREGVFISPAAAIVSSDGRLVMTGGTYRIAETGTTVPQLTGAYSLSAGTIDLNGSGNQILRGARDYVSLAFSTSGTKTLSSALPANSLSDLVTIRDAAILDVANNDFSGTSALDMTGTSRFRLSLLNTTLPQLTGTYTLTGGTVELYGTNATQTHSLRGGVTYNNVELNSVAANVAAGQANVLAGAGFGLRGTMTVQSPTCFQLGSAFTISDAGSSTFAIAPGATFKFGGAIESIGLIGNVQTDVRTFPGTASYGFVGSVNPQATGSAFPTAAVNIYVDKATATDAVLIPSNLSISNQLILGTGILEPSANTITITNTAVNAIVGGSASSFVAGRLSRTLPASLVSGSTYDFPVGEVGPDMYLPLQLVNPTTGVGTTTVATQAFNFGSGGTGDINSITAVSGTEYWSFTTTGNYTGGAVNLTRTTPVGTFNTIARSTTTAAGNYSFVGGTPSGNSINNSNNIAANTLFLSMATAIGPPVISTVVPTSPAFAGQLDNTGYVGQTLTITGSNFTTTPNMSVSIGGLPATTFTVVNSTTITAVVAQNASGTNVVVTNTVTSGAASAAFTFLGWISNANTDWNVNTTWLGNVIPPVNVAVTIAHAVTVNATVTNNPNTLTIRTGNSLTFGAAGNLTVNSTLANNGSVVMTAGGNLNFASGATFNNGTATFTGGAGTVTFNGSGTVITTGGVPFNNLTLNGAVNAGSGSSISATGTLRVNEGGSLTTSAITYNAGGTLLYNGSNNQTPNAFEWPVAGGPTNFHANNPAQVVLNFDRSLSGNVRIFTGTLRTSGGRTLTMTGAAATLEVTGNLLGTDAGVGNDLTLVIDGTTTVTGSSSTCKVFNATVNTGATLALARNNFEVRYGTFAVNGTGTLRIDANGNVAGFDGNSRVPVYASTANLVYNSGGAYGRFVEWSTLSGPAGYPGNVIVQNGTTLNIGTPSTDLGIANDLLLGQTGSAGSLNMGSTAQGITVNGSVTIGSNTGTSTLTLSTNGSSPAIRVGANWTRTSNGVFVGTGASGRGVFFIGGTNGSITAPTSETFEFMIMQKTAGSNVTINQPVTVNQTLNFNGGTITLGNFNLTAGSITGGSATSFAATTGTGRLRRNVNNTDILFPVGPSTSVYSPATLNQQGTAEIIGVRVGTAPAFSQPVNDNNQMLNLEWNMDETTAGLNSLVTRFQWPVTAEAGGFIRANGVFHGNWDGSQYVVRPTSATTGSNPYISQSNANFTSNLSNMGFVVGNINGIIGCFSTANNGSWNSTGTWSSGIVPPADVSVCLNHNVTVGALDPNPNNVISVTMNAGSSLLLDVSKTLTFSNGGALINNTGSAQNMGAGTLVGNGIMAFSGTQPITANNVTLNGNTTINTSPTITGTLQLNAGASLTAAPTYGPASTLVYNTGAAYGVFNEWTGTGAAGLGVPFNVNINTTTLNMPNANRGLAGNLNINGGALNLNGTSGDLLVGGNWTRAAAASFNANGRAVFFNGAADQTIAVTGGGTETFSYLITNKSGGNLILSAAQPTNVTVSASIGNVLEIGNNNTIDLNGRTLILSGTGGNLNLAGGTANIIGGANSLVSISGGTKTVTPNGGATLSFGSNVTVALNSGMNFGNTTSTINGTLQIALGGFVQTNAPTYATGSTLRYFTGNAFNRGAEWSTNSGPGYPFNVTVDQNGTVTTVNLAPGSGVCQIAGNLTINNGAAVSMGNMGIPLNVRGSVTVGGALSGTLTLSTAPGGDMQVGGNLTRNAGGTLTQFSREVEMNGTTTQDIFNFASFSLLAINNSVAPVRINNNTLITERLRLAAGTFNLNGFSTTMANNSMILRANGVMSAAPSLAGTDQYDMRYDASVTSSVEYLSSATAVRDLIVSNGVTLTLDANRTFNRNLELAGGDLNLGGFTMTARGRTTAPSFSGSITVTGGGTRNINGPAGSRFNITGLGGNVPLEYTKTVSSFGGTQLSFGSDVLVAIGDGAVDFGAGSPTTINGVLQVLLGGSVGQVLNPCVYAPGSILRFANTVDYQVGLNDKTWAAGSISSGLPGIPFNVEVNDVGTDLQLQDTRALRGNLTITSGTFTLTNTFTGAFNIGGNWTRTGASSAFIHNDRGVIFNGLLSGSQTITVGTGVSEEIFFDLGVSMSSGDLLTAVGTGITVRNNLNFTAGRLNMGANPLVIGTSTVNGSITGFSNTRYVIVTTGTIRQFANTNGVNYQFPMGDASNFTPFRVTLDNGAQAGAFLTTTLFTVSHPNAVGSTHYLNRYWKVEPSGLATSPVYDVEFTYAASDIVGTESTYRPVKYTTSTASPGWISAPGSGAAAIDGTAANFDLPSKTFTWENLTTFSEFTAAGDGSPLPVELLNFSADVAGNTVVLNWTTASEINNDYFTVERSADALNFTAIGTVDGAGNSSLTRNYQLIDANPLPGVSYYRLRQTDFNGDFELFGPVAVNFSGSSLTGVALFPNPTNEFSHVMINANHGGKGWVRVTDITGRIVANYQIVLEKGVTPFTLQTSDLAPGQYMVSVETADGKLYNLPLIKQ